MKRFFAALAILPALCLAQPEYAPVESNTENLNSLQQLEQEDARRREKQEIEKNLEALDELKQRTERMLPQVDRFVEDLVADRVYRCIRVFPSRTYCECVARDLWMSHSFIEYVAAVSTPPENFREDITQEQKESLGHFYELREKCSAMTGK